MKLLKISLKQKISVVLLSFFIISCNQAVAKSYTQAMEQQNDKHAKPIKSADASQEYRGVYYGFLPCKGCPGYKTTLSLKNKSNYLLVTQEAKASSREYYEKGKYTWDDKSHTVTLTARKDSSIRKFRIKNEDTLVQLSPEGEQMQGEQSRYTLHKTKSEDEKRH